VRVIGRANYIGALAGDGVDMDDSPLLAWFPSCPPSDGGIASPEP
jgi:hypothetical protein